MSIILPHTQLVLSISNIQGGAVLAKILGSSERGVDYWSITYECSGTAVTHDCAPRELISPLCVNTPWPTPAPSTANRSEAWEENLVEVGRFFCALHHPLLLMG